MTTRGRFPVLLLVAGGLGLLLVVFHPQAEEIEPSALPPVSEAELQAYIKVYTAMQDDHDLTIEGAIKPEGFSLDEFRHLERRVQAEPRFVDRIRQALLDHAKEHSVVAQSMATASPAATPAPRQDPQRTRPRSERHR